MMDDDQSMSMDNAWEDQLRDTVAWNAPDDPADSARRVESDAGIGNRTQQSLQHRMHSRVPAFARPDRPRNPRSLRIPIELLGLMVLVVAIGAAGIVVATRNPGSDEIELSGSRAPVVITDQTPDTAAIQLDMASPAAVNTDSGEFAGIVVCLDPGHGGSDRGFIHQGSSSVVAMEEAPVTLSLAQDLAKELEAAGFTVVLTRTTDSEVNVSAEDTTHDGVRSAGATPEPGTAVASDPDEVQARINICNNAEADIMVSLHLGYASRPEMMGSVFWYSGSQPYAPFSKLLAASIASDMAGQLAAAGYVGPVPLVSGLDSETAGLSQTPDMLLIEDDTTLLNRPSTMPAVFGETLMISNDSDAAALEQPEIRSAIVAGYREAIERYAAQMIPRWRSMENS